jgi:hypothetical protein
MIEHELSPAGRHIRAGIVALLYGTHVRTYI